MNLVSLLNGARAARRARVRGVPHRPCEPLEPRRLLSLGTSVAATEPTFEVSETGVLTVTATPDADAVRVAPNGDGDAIDFTVNGVSRSFTRTGLSRVDVLGLAGDDAFTLVSGVGTTVRFYGGDGADTLHAVLLGDEAYALLDGGGGADALVVEGSPADDRLAVSNDASDGPSVSGAGALATAGVESVRVNGNGGNDSLSSYDTRSRVVLDGGPGNDEIGPDLSNSPIPAGPDELLGGEGDDRLYARNDRPQLVDGGPGNDIAQADADDRLVNVETARGGVYRGVVYNDLNANGTRDPGEPGLYPAGVSLVDPAVAEVRSTTTAPDGTYTIVPSPAFPTSQQMVALLVQAPSGFHAFSRFDRAVVWPPGPAETVVQDFGFVETPTAPSVGGLVYYQFQFDKVPLPGFTVFNDANDNGTLDAGEPSARTGLDGRYLLPELPPGQQVIRVLLAPGTGPYRPGGDVLRLSVGTGQAFIGADFRLPDTVPSAFGSVFNDLDADRVKDANEPYLGGVTVYKDFNANGQYDPFEEVAVTAANGRLRAMLGRGTHRLGVRLPAGWQTTRPTGGLLTATLDTFDEQNFNFGIRQVSPTGVVRGTVVADVDGDAVRGPFEAGRAREIVYGDADDDGAFDPGEPVTTTDAQGNYELALLAGESYRVRLLLRPSPTEYQAGLNSHLVTVTSGQVVTGKDFFVATGSAIAGTVYDDRNGDGGRDPGEAGLAGWQVELRDLSNGTVGRLIRTVTTDADGHYVAAGLPAAASRIGASLVRPAGWTSTGGPVDSAGVPVVPGQSYPSLDLSAIHGSVVSGLVLDDSNLDRMLVNAPDSPNQDPGLVEWTVFADVNHNGTFDPGEPSDVTDSQGLYQFGIAAPGTYTVKVIPMPGYAATQPDPSGEQLVNLSQPRRVFAEFGFADVGEITGTVFFDADRDGVIDPDDGPLSGAVVFIDDNSNGFPDPGERAEATGTDGRYTFKGLAPDRYFVNIYEPAGVAQTLPTSGGYNVTVAAGRCSEAPPFALTRTSAVVGGFVFYNHSTFDGNDAAANAADDKAIAPDKVSLRPHGPLSVANVTNYSRGINGVMVDIAGLPQGTTPTPADFFISTRVDGARSSPWDPAPGPSSVTVRRGAGAGGSDRVTLVWPDDTFRNTWVRVGVAANERTGLYQGQSVYFGNLVGEADASVPAGATALRVNALDLAAVKRELNTNAPLTSRVDFNRDGRVNALDLGLVKLNLNRFLPVVKWPGPTPEPAAPLVPDGGGILRSDDELLG